MSWDWREQLVGAGYVSARKGMHCLSHQLHCLCSSSGGVLRVLFWVQELPGVAQGNGGIQLGGPGQNTGGTCTVYGGERGRSISGSRHGKNKVIGKG